MFELDLRSRAPIYEQLTEKIIELIVTKVLKADEQLPTVRVLAGELTVNPNTVQKAYRELEYRGYIYSLPGKGNFVKPTVPEQNTARLKTLEAELLRIISEMSYLGMSPRQIMNIVQHSLPESRGGMPND